MSGPNPGGVLLRPALPFQQNFIAVAAPGVIGALAVDCVRMSLSASAQTPLAHTASTL